MKNKKPQSSPIDLTETTLIKQAKQGNQEAFYQLTKPYYQKLYNIGMRMLHNSEDAADMTQETMLKLFRHLSDYRGNATFSTWLYRIAVNTCKDMLRSACRRKEISFTDFSDGDENIVFQLPDNSNIPELIYEEKLSADQMKVLIDALDSRFRIVLLLREIGGLSYREIAESVNISEGTVKSRISRGRAMMRKAFEQDRTTSKTDSSYIQKEA